MTSKQEKLAAARRKLKEFQGKNKGRESTRHKNVSEVLSSQSYEGSAHTSTESSPSNTVLPEESKSLGFLKADVYDYNVNLSENKKEALEECKSPRKLSDSFSTKSNSPTYWLGGSQSCNDKLSQNVESENFKSDVFCEKDTEERNSRYLNELNSSESRSATNSESHVFDGNNGYQFNNNRKESSLLDDQNKKVSERLMPEQSNSNLFPEVYTHSHLKESKEFFNNDFISSSALNDIIKPLQIELQNHAQTINILVQQRNDAQNSLAQAQNLLTVKAGEMQELEKHMTFLTSCLNDLNQKLSEAEEMKKKLYLENEENKENNNSIKSKYDELQTKFDSKEEEYLELKRKYEEKSKECQHLLFRLQETQSQLSLCQIQIQQFSTVENTGLNERISDLQNENFNLRQKIEDLGKQLQAVNAENEQSSQKFHIYAQQCNSQLSSLNSQVKTFTTENENLKQEIAILSKSLADAENLRECNMSTQTYTTEIADLHTQISDLTEENIELQKELKKKEVDLTEVNKQMENKNAEIKDLEVLLENLETENKKLLNEIDTPRGNERLLAAMESDKVAAAKAVSQNQKLKEQIVEFEKAIMKLNEEKLELTDQLAHEKHIKKELEARLENFDHDHHNHHDHHDHHEHSDGHECNHHHEKVDKLEPLVNDSNEIEELRKIIRQLQDDKVELKARLNSFTSIKSEPNTESNKKELKSDLKENGSECEDNKLHLQQLEEKVRKTMNEIAILDEEKEKLEHLVLQLQGETETIGEYITLYQTQRMLLRQRAIEKDNQLVQLSKEKEDLRSKLIALDQLVQHLVSERKNFNLQSGSDQSDLSPPPVEASETTAIKIRELINEIGSTTLVSKNSVAFEHYSCCSGKLITI